MCRMGGDSIGLSISAINVNTLNVSSFKESGCKSIEKLVSIMQRGSDVILMSDCRLGKGIEKIRRVMQLGKETSYDLYANSTRGERGVCIAISRERDVEIIEEVRDTVSENYLLLRCKMDQKEMVLGVVYGPNTNNREF